MISHHSLALICSLSLSCWVAFAPTSAQANQLTDFFFGEEVDPNAPPPPEKSLQAPFSNSDASAPTGGDSSLMKMYSPHDAKLGDQDGLSLGSPHRSPQQIEEWAVGVATQAMTVHPEHLDDTLKALTPAFTPYALEEYKTFLTSTNVVASLQSNNMRMQSISEGLGSVIKEGEMGGTYHWMVQIPVMTTYYDKNMTGFDPNNMVKVPSRKSTLRLQIGRVRAAKGEDMGIAVERWIVYSAK